MKAFVFRDPAQIPRRRPSTTGYDELFKTGNPIPIEVLDIGGEQYETITLYRMDDCGDFAMVRQRQNGHYDIFTWVQSGGISNRPCEPDM